MKQLLLFSLFFLPQLIFATCDPNQNLDLYWKGGSGDYTDPSNWWVGNFNSGTEPCQSPRSGDNVFFTAAAFSSASSTIIVGQNANCKNFIWDNTIANTVIFDDNGSNSINFDVYGSMTLIAQMQFNFNGHLRFLSTKNGTETLETAGQNLRLMSMVIEVSSATELRLLSKLTVNNPSNNSGRVREGVVKFNSGHFNTNGQVMDLDAFQSRSGNSNRTLTIDNSYIRLDARGWYPAIWRLDFNSGATNYTGFSTIGSHIHFNSGGTTDVIQWGQNTAYDSVSFDLGMTRMYLEHTASFNHFDMHVGNGPLIHRNGVFTIQDMNMQAASSYLLQGSATALEMENFTGPTACDQAFIQRFNGAGRIRKVTGGNLLLNNVVLASIDPDISGGRSYTASNSILSGSTVNVTATAPMGCQTDLYFRDNAGDNDWHNVINWEDALGNPAMSLPSMLTNVYFDNLSFPNANKHVRLSRAGQCNDIRWKNTVVNNADFRLTYPLHVNGTVELTTNMDRISEGSSGWEQGRGFILYGNGDSIITKGVNIASRVQMTAGSDYTLIDTFSGNGLYMHSGSHLHTDNARISLNHFVAARRSMNDTKVYFVGGGWPALSATDNNFIQYTGNCTFYFNGTSIQTVNGYTPNVVINNNNILYPGGLRIQGDLRFNSSVDLSLNSRGYTNTVGWTVAGDVNITPGVELVFSDNVNAYFRVAGDLNSVGNCGETTTIRSYSGGSTEIDISGNSNIQFNYLKGLNFPTPHTVMNAVDGGNNTNITFNVGGTTPQTFYWRANRNAPTDFTGNWSDADHWTTNPANTVGDGTCVPYLEDSVVFDNLSLSASSNGCTIDNNAYCKGLNCLVGIELNGTGTGQGNLFNNGSLILHPATQFNYSGNIKMVGSGEINTAGNPLYIKELVFDNPTGRWKMLSELELLHNYNTRYHGVFRLNAGTFVSNDFDIYMDNRFESSNSNPRALVLGNSTWTMRMKGYYYIPNPSFNPWHIRNSTNMSISGGTVHFLDGNYSSNGKKIYLGDGLVYDHVIIEDNDERIVLDGDVDYRYAQWASNMEVLGSNTFDSLALTGGFTYSFEKGTTQELNAPHGFIRMDAVGPGNFVNLESTVSNQLAFINKDYGDQFCMDYIKVKDIKATKETNLTLVPTTPTDYQAIHPLLAFQTGLNSDSISIAGGNWGIWEFSLPPLTPPQTTGLDTIVLCKTGTNLSYPIEITGTSPYLIDYTWTDQNGNTGGQTGIITYDDDNNPTTPYFYNVPLAANSRGFDYTVDVSTLRCGERFQSTPVNTHVKIPNPQVLVAQNRTGACHFFNSNEWFTIVDQVEERPILSIQDSIAPIDLAALGLVNTEVQFDATIQYVNYSGINFPYLQRHWIVNPENNGPAKIRFYFTQAELNALAAANTFNGNYNGGLDPLNDLTVLKYSNAGDIIGASTPQQIAHSVVPLTAANTTAFSSTSGMIGIEIEVSSFSHFIIIPTFSALLPLELTEFDVRKAGRDVEIAWSNSQDVEIASYTVQRSANTVDVEHWETVTTIQENNHLYTVIDQQPMNGISYYRLQAETLAGKTIYSEWKAVEFEGQSIRNVYPNPADEQVNLELYSSLEEQVDITLLNALGQVVYQEQKNLTVGNQTLELNTSKLQAGWFLIQVASNQQTIQYKIVIE